MNLSDHPATFTINETANLSVLNRVQLLFFKFLVYVNFAFAKVEKIQRVLKRSEADSLRRQRKDIDYFAYKVFFRLETIINDPLFAIPC